MTQTLSFTRKTTTLHQLLGILPRCHGGVRDQMQGTSLQYSRSDRKPVSVVERLGSVVSV